MVMMLKSSTEAVIVLLGTFGIGKYNPQLKQYGTKPPPSIIVKSLEKITIPYMGVPTESVQQLGFYNMGLFPS